MKFTMNLRWLLMGIILLVLAINVSAQNQYSISGYVVDASDSSLLGTALLLSPADSSLIKGAYIQDGQFELVGIKQKEALLKLRSTGFRDTILLISNADMKNIDLDKLAMVSATQGIDGVTVVGKLPLFESSEEGVKVNVQNTMLSASTSLLEVLGKSPGVVVGEDGVRVIGKGVALLYLDGNPVTIQQLSTVAVSDVKNIEIISNPSAQYDANGKAVINISTIVNTSEGFSGTVVTNATYAGYPNAMLGSANATINYRKGKWSLAADYGNQIGTDWEQLKATRTLDTDQGLFTSENSHLYRNKLANSSFYRLGSGYHFNKNHKLSLELRGYWGVTNLNENVSNVLELTNGTNAELSTENNGKRKSLTTSVITNYTGKLDTLGSTIFVGAQYSQFGSNRNEPILERYAEEGTELYVADRLSRGMSDIRIMTSQVDYTKAFKNKAKFTAGGKIANTRNDGSTNFFSRLVGEPVYTEVTALTNAFTYDETVPAAYAQFAGVIGKKIKYRTGLRAEYTMADGFSLSLNQQVIDTNYVNVFPTAAIIANVSSTFSIGASYSARIGRPHYRQLDPFIYYQDSLTSFQGNPFLRPELTQAYELDFNIQGFNFLKVGYNHSQNSFRDLIEQGSGGPNSVILRKINVQQLNSYFAKLSVPVDLKFWSSFNTISLTFDQVIDNRPQFVLTRIRPQFYFYSYNKFIVKDWFNIELFGEYVGSKNDGIYFDEDTYSISAGLSKSFFDKKLSCRLIANDIFRTFRQAGSFEVGNATVVYHRRLSTNFYRLSLTYKFGKLKQVNYSNKETGKEERERLRER